MKQIKLYLIILSTIVLGIVSCSKEPSLAQSLYADYFESSNGNNGTNGDETKVDIKGSLMNGDMKRPNIAAKIKENTLYVYFFETIEDCMTLVTAENGDVLFSRRMAKQYPGTVRVFMGDEPTGFYRLYITDGTNEASGEFYFVQQTNYDKQ